MYEIKQKSDRARYWFGRIENRYLSPKRYVDPPSHHLQSKKFFEGQPPIDNGVDVRSKKKKKTFHPPPTSPSANRPPSPTTKKFFQRPTPTHVAVDVWSKKKKTFSLPTTICRSPPSPTTEKVFPEANPPTRLATSRSKKRKILRRGVGFFCFGEKEVR
jgi:hypothetical protein